MKNHGYRNDQARSFGRILQREDLEGSFQASQGSEDSFLLSQRKGNVGDSSGRANHPDSQHSERRSQGNLVSDGDQVSLEGRRVEDSGNREVSIRPSRIDGFSIAPKEQKGILTFSGEAKASPDSSFPIRGKMSNREETKRIKNQLKKVMEPKKFQETLTQVDPKRSESHVHSGETPFRFGKYTGIRVITVFRKDGRTTNETRYFVLGLEVKPTWFSRVKHIWETSKIGDESLAEFCERNENSLLNILK